MRFYQANTFQVNDSRRMVCILYKYHNLFYVFKKILLSSIIIKSSDRNQNTLPFSSRYLHYNGSTIRQIMPIFCNSTFHTTPNIYRFIAITLDVHAQTVILPHIISTIMFCIQSSQIPSFFTIRMRIDNLYRE